MKDLSKLEAAFDDLQSHASYSASDADKSLTQKHIKVLNEVVEVLSRNTADIQEIINRANAIEQYVRAIDSQVQRNELALRGDEWQGTAGLMASQRAVSESLTAIKTELFAVRGELEGVKSAQVRATVLQILTGGALLVVIVFLIAGVI